MLDVTPIKERCEKATPGPWFVQDDKPPNDAWYPGITIGSEGHGTRVADVCALSGFREADAALIAAARTDLPALVEEVERLREALPDPAKLEALADWFDRHDADLGYAETDVQDDLRAWAAAARRTLTEGEGR